MFTFKIHNCLVTGDGLLFVFGYNKLCSFYHYSILFYFVSALRLFAYLKKFYPPFFPLQKTDLFDPKKLTKVNYNVSFCGQNIHIFVSWSFILSFLIRQSLRECTYCFVFINLLVLFTLTCY